MAISRSLLFPLFCGMLFFYFNGHVHGEEAFAKVSLHRIIPSSNCSRSKAGGVDILRIVNRNSACSGKLQRERNPTLALSQDALRVASIQASVTGTSTQIDVLIGSQISIPAKSGLYIGTANYVITVRFGTPAQTQTVIFDTGSDVSWIQCKPCVVACYPQQELLFDPSRSSTYRNVACTEPACTGLPRRGCSNGTCLYGVTYGDGSSTVGFLARDTFTLTSASVFPSFIFGCGQNNRGLFRGAAGLMGLGRSSYSLNSQLARTYGNVFSYCLSTANGANGYLNFGNPLKSPVRYTPLLTDPRAPSLYFIDLIGITVGGTRLAISPTTFRSVGTIIDSGTVITRLPAAAYSALRTAFRAAMRQYTLVQGASILDTCYDFSRVTSVTYPVIQLLYTGVNYTVPGTGVFYVIRSSQVCLAFAGNSVSTDIGIIGNVQQKTVEVTHDNVLNRIGFASGGCT